MGGNGSKATVLENMIKNFKKGFDADDGRTMTPGRLRTLCEVEWPSVGVSRPSEGIMDLNVIKAVYGRVTGKRAHPDQFLHIDSWLGIAQEPPPAPCPKWACFYTHGGEGKILMAQKVTKDEEEIFSQLSHSVVSNSLRPHESQHARPPCPPPTPGVHPDSRPSSQ